MTSGYLAHHLTQVERHYARLFEDVPALSVALGDLVFTGVSDDPATLATLSALGFQRPEAAAETVRGWHFGRRAAVRSPRARSAVGIDAGAARSLRRIGRPGRRAFRFRRSAGAHAGERPAPFDLALEQRLTRVVWRRAWERPAAGAGDRVPGCTCSTLRLIRRAASTSTRASTTKRWGAGRDVRGPRAEF